MITGIRRINRNTTVFTMALVLFISFALTAGAVEKMDDSKIGNAVDDALLLDESTPVNDIDVDTDEGIVTLTGSVNNILAKDRAEELAETVKGVRGIINRIEVDPVYRTDTVIAENVRDSLLINPATKLWEIETTVEDGEVTLTGTVDSWQERELAAKVAKGVNGVVAVDNQIAIDYAADRSDIEIENEIEEVLRWNAYIDGALIEVDVDDGNVVLSGTVGSLAEKSEATTQAWVRGIKSVENEIDVESWARDERFRKDKYVDYSDSQIEEAVQNAFLYDPRVNMFDIDTEVEMGQVTLRGTVDNLKAKRAAAEDARRVVGVWGVANKLKVRFETELSDSAIESNIEDALAWDPYVAGYEIDVTVVDGTAYLYGEVDSTFEKAQADDIAASQDGVLLVRNYLTVNVPTTVTYEPYADDWYPSDFAWYTSVDYMTDKEEWEIEKDISDQLFWSPFVEHEEVDVEVEDGTAILTGVVDTWNERQAATEAAWDGGAGVVDNRLEVEYGPASMIP